MLTAAAGRDLHTAGDMAAVLDSRLTALMPTDPGPLPCLPGIPSGLHADPVWGAYLAKRSQLVADLADQVQDHVCQRDGGPAWLEREVIPPPWFAKSQCGVPPTASILRTRDQQEEEASSIQPPPCGDSDSTGRSHVPPIHQATAGSTNDRPHTPHLFARTTTTGAHTKHPSSVRTGQPHPAANPPSNCCAGACGSPNGVMVVRVRMPARVRP
jgi:hypothetical protein